MSAIEFRRVNKIYADGSHAIYDLSLEIRQGELLVLAGPSGCGKSTLLRLLAGLEDITSGDILLDGRCVKALEPQQRNVAMVFQNYALYPHMSVRQNMAFPLRMRNVPERQRRQRVEEVAGLLGLTDLLEKRPQALSGGQRQRVAMGRALVREPAVFLMDEPLSNLDPNLRLQIRMEIAHLQRTLDITTIYVTHDQTEAMALADRLAVLRAGSLQQLAPPLALYDRPANIFVADFFGMPGMNILPVIVRQADQQSLCLETAGGKLQLPGSLCQEHPLLVASLRQPLLLGIRPEDLHLATRDESEACLTVEPLRREYVGNEQLLYFTFPAQQRSSLAATAYPDQVREVLERQAAYAARLPARPDITITAAPLSLALAPARCRFFDRQGMAID
ncbi:MAG: ABC transporter ATP-binding protein [Gammaproteobacteria bacterium]